MAGVNDGHHERRPLRVAAGVLLFRYFSGLPTGRGFTIFGISSGHRM